jgi:hypothetical protein
LLLLLPMFFLFLPMQFFCFVSVNTLGVD